MEGLKLIPYIALVLTIAGVILGASVLVSSKFGDTMTKCWNSSYSYYNDIGKCTNNSATDVGADGLNGLNFSDEYYTVDRSIESLGTVAEQQPTVAIIAVMVIIISIIAGVFVYMRYFS